LAVSSFRCLAQPHPLATRPNPVRNLAMPREPLTPDQQRHASEAMRHIHPGPDLPFERIAINQGALCIECKARPHGRGGIRAAAPGNGHQPR
jgi:hypothetical protein